jgi:hypothetical protein
MSGTNMYVVQKRVWNENGALMQKRNRYGMKMMRVVHGT